MLKLLKKISIRFLWILCCLFIISISAASNAASSKVSSSTSSLTRTKATASNAATHPETELKSLLSQLESLQGNFQQKMSTEQGKLLQQCEGKMWLKKPGQFRWEVLGKDKRIVVGNGKKIWDYDLDLEQVTIQQLSKGQNSAPIFFLTGDVNSISRDFKVAIYKPEADNFKGSEKAFELKPKSAEGSFQWIRIGFKNNLLSELEVLDHLGQRSNFTFSQVQLNPNIPNNLFQFTPPKGVDVVGL
jgi:outer membrane lipoprotein carrier protein